jgi:hypothetical protein
MQQKGLNTTAATRPHGTSPDQAFHGADVAEDFPDRREAGYRHQLFEAYRSGNDKRSRFLCNIRRLAPWQAGSGTPSDFKWLERPLSVNGSLVALT